MQLDRERRRPWRDARSWPKEFKEAFSISCQFQRLTTFDDARNGRVARRRVSGDFSAKREFSFRVEPRRPEQSVMVSKSSRKPFRFAARGRATSSASETVFQREGNGRACSRSDFIDSRRKRRRVLARHGNFCPAVVPRASPSMLDATISYIGGSDRVDSI